MKAIVAALIFSASHLLAERLDWKPTDFEPLTDLPWKRPDATIESVIEAIFREPIPAIRYPVLAEYLRIMPAGQLGDAFDRCVHFEGTQTPDDLVAFFLEIWAERNPQPCWKRTQNLFHLVGIEEGWLGYDDWTTRPRITVQDRDAIRASPFWLTSVALKSFPLGVARSGLPKAERIEMMNAFAQTWFKAFGTWPGYPLVGGPDRLPRGYPGSFSNLKAAFEIKPTSHLDPGNFGFDETAYEIALRRWLKSDPSSALEVVAKAQATKWPPQHGNREERSAGPSVELLMIWAKADLPALIRWADALDFKKGEVALEARAFLMSQVDAETGERWLAEAKSADPDADNLRSLLARWAGWDPKPAIKAAITTGNREVIEETVIFEPAVGPWGGFTWNSTHFNIGEIKDFDITSIPEDIRADLLKGEWEEVVETWGDVDIGETARYGVKLLLQTGVTPKERLIKFFSGSDEYQEDGNVVDRTFCALRVWAVVRPDEMKAWIGTIKDPEMREALTWLLENPWGTGPEQ